MLYNLENWQLILDGNSKTFGTKHGRPPYLRKARLNINTYWIRALNSIDDEILTTTLGDVLDERRITALASRRDELLEPK